jgi:hypothetical protein
MVQVPARFRPYSIVKGGVMKDIPALIVALLAVASIAFVAKDFISQF